MGLLNGYKMLLSTKQKVFTFKDSLKRGSHSSPSKMNMTNSVIIALLTCLHLLNEYMIYCFILNISVLFYTMTVEWEVTSKTFVTVPPYISLVRTIWTNYESKKCLPQAQSCLDNLRDVSLPPGSIADPCFPCSSLHGFYYLSHDFT